MQGKGAIRFFAIALAIACIYSLSFTWVAYRVEQKAIAASNGDPALEARYLDSVANIGIFNLGIKNFTYQQVKERQLNLGLDLKGGMNVTMEISLVDLIRSLSNNSQDSTFNKALRLAQERQSTSQKDFITLFSEAFTELAPNGRLASVFATQENRDRINFNTSDADVLRVLRAEGNSAIERSFNILRTRIDRFGVTQPNIQLQQGTNRILIELPGVTDPERVRKLLQGSAQLEFWETYDNAEVFGVLDAANKNIAAKIALTDTVKKTTTESITTSDTTGIALLNEIKGTDTTNASADFEKQNPLFAKLSPAIFQTEAGQQLQPGSVIGYAAMRDTAIVNRYLAQADVKALFPVNLRFAWGVKAFDNNNVFELHALKATTRDGKPALEGDVISNARDDFDQRGNPEVVMIMNADGAKTWRRITAEASADANNKKSVAIVLDGNVYSAPTVQNEIPNGISSISGNFKIEDTKDLANILKAGKLPAPARIVEEAIVGPSLGQEAINAGLLSSIAGLILVLIFMVVYYNRAGWVADVALVVNLFFVMGVMASLGAVLTLPGIAGIVLTIGMSVDANVLIYERIREELSSGKSFRVAISDGYKAAYSSIIDANVTTLITGIILAMFGSGPILGFATTLIIGILTSLFCAIFITRLIFEAKIDKSQTVPFFTKLSKNVFTEANYDFLGKRKIFFGVSSVIIVAGLISIFTKGLSLGVDFQGGRSYVVRFDDAVNTSEIRSTLAGAFNGAPEVKTFGESNQVKITTSYLINDNSEETDQIVEDKLKSGLVGFAGGTGEILSSQKVGPTIANDIKIGAIYAVLASFVVIFLYILYRFKRWQFGLGALVALLHDVLFLLALFSIFDGILPFSLEIDQAFIAAILTVMGYSLNDTVVVFDRIREYINLHHSKNDTLATVINNAINSTLSRTVVTGVTTIIVLSILFIFGGPVIRGFTFAMLIGVIVGTYSSIFVAAPVVVDFIRKKK